MKRMYEKPMAYEERFLSENYCTSACYSLYCLISGDGNNFTSISKFQNNQKYRDWKQKSGMNFNPGDTNLDHGKPCAQGSSLNSDGNYYEFNKKSAVGSIDLGKSAGNGKYYATWQSINIETNSSGGHDTYNHYGYAVPDSQNPNHS